MNMPPKPRPMTASGKRVKAIRDAIGLNQGEAAKRIGVSRATWNGWETRGLRVSKSHQILLRFLAEGKL